MCGLHSVLVSESILPLVGGGPMLYGMALSFCSIFLSLSVCRPPSAYAVAVSLVSWLSRALAQGGRVPSLLLPLRSSDLRLDPKRATYGKESLRDFLEAERPTHENTDRRTEKKKEWADLLVF